MAFLLAGCGSRFARSGGCRSFSTRTVDRSLRSIVRRRHHRLRTSSGCTPLGYVVIAQVKGIPRRFSGPPCRAVSHRNVEAPHLTNARQQLERAVLEDAPPEGGGVVIGYWVPQWPPTPVGGWRRSAAQASASPSALRRRYVTGRHLTTETPLGSSKRITAVNARRTDGSG